MSRPVPRNIDKPNRITEYVVTFVIVYYSVMFFSRHALVSFGAAFLMVYIVNKLTMDKPEGQAYRTVYKYIQIGRMRPTPAKVKHFEVS